MALLPQYNKAPAVTAERMYLETMQQILNRSSKILVDAKAGNVFYLPLDKLAANASATSIAESSAVNATNTTSILGTNALNAEQGMNRRSYRQGRSENENN